MSNLEQTIHNSIEGGSYLERKRMIELLEATLVKFPNLTVQQFVPPLLDKLKEMPAPQTLIDMEKFKLKFGLNDFELQKFLKKVVKEMEENL
jgi:hypothetical protein